MQVCVHFYRPFLIILFLFTLITPSLCSSYLKCIVEVDREETPDKSELSFEISLYDDTSPILLVTGCVYRSYLKIPCQIWLNSASEESGLQGLTVRSSDPLMQEILNPKKIVFTDRWAGAGLTENSSRLSYIIELVDEESFNENWRTNLVNIFFHIPEWVQQNTIKRPHSDEYTIKCRTYSKSPPPRMRLQPESGLGVSSGRKPSKKNRTSGHSKNIYCTSCQNVCKQMQPVSIVINYASGSSASSSQPPPSESIETLSDSENDESADDEDSAAKNVTKSRCQHCNKMFNASGIQTHMNHWCLTNTYSWRSREEAKKALESSKQPMTATTALSPFHPPRENLPEKLNGMIEDLTTMKTRAEKLEADEAAFQKKQEAFKKQTENESNKLTHKKRALDQQETELNAKQTKLDEDIKNRDSLQQQLADTQQELETTKKQKVLLEEKYQRFRDVEEVFKRTLELESQAPTSTAAIAISTGITPAASTVWASPFTVSPSSQTLPTTTTTMPMVASNLSTPQVVYIQRTQTTNQQAAGLMMGPSPATGFTFPTAGFTTVPGIVGGYSPFGFGWPRNITGSTPSIDDVGVTTSSHDDRATRNDE